MPALVIVGVQWGDEGKGKITDFLAERASGIVRYQGGNNAGHTVLVGQEKYKLHLIPSGILYKSKRCILGNGVVVDLPDLVSELDALERRGVDTSNFFLSVGAHLILPHHRWLDSHEEERKGAEQIGTTRKGIGPAYTDKVHRRGIRVGDLLHTASLKRRLGALQESFEREHPGAGLDWEAATAACLEAFGRIQSRIIDTSEMIARMLDDGESVLFEGAQGTFLDLDHGTYPFVTSSTPTAGGACVGAGIGPTRIDAVMGVTKAYTTRVGSGPFVTELTDAVGEHLTEVGAEFGTTTGRRRRCGWLDAVMLRYSARINGLTSLAVTKLDVLDQLDPIRIATAYRTDLGVLENFPTDLETLQTAEPVYETFPGWRQPTTPIRSLDDLPGAARRYLDRIEELTAVPVDIVSVGAERSTTVTVTNPWDRAL